jgi:hypothetical protein
MRAKWVNPMPDRDELAHQVRSQILPSNYVYTARSQVVARVLTPARVAIERSVSLPVAEEIHRGARKRGPLS